MPSQDDNAQASIEALNGRLDQSLRIFGVAALMSTPLLCAVSMWLAATPLDPDAPLSRGMCLGAMCLLPVVAVSLTALRSAYRDHRQVADSIAAGTRQLGEISRRVAAQPDKASR